jgi:hypothetical protein
MDARYSSEGRPDSKCAVERRLATGAAVAGGVLVLCGVSAQTWAQDLPSVPPPAMRHAGPTAGPAKGSSSLNDDFAGLNYTAQQKANIQLIQKSAKMRKDSVLKDEKLSAEQRDAMLQGLDRIERGQLYRALSPEQQAEVRKRLVARREAQVRQREQQEQQARQHSSAPPPLPR